MTTRITIALAAVLSVGWLVAPRLGAQTGALRQQAETQPAQTKSQPSQASHQMPMKAEDMSKMHQQMMEEMKAEQAKLDSLAKNMNGATGDAKVRAMAYLLTELVRDHGKMIDHMGSMHEHMMNMTK